MIHARREPPRLEPAGPRSRDRRRAGGFTLVELLVVAVLMMVLGSLMLTAAAAARKRVKIDRTRSTGVRASARAFQPLPARAGCR